MLIGQNEPDANRRRVYFWLVQSNGTTPAAVEATNRPQWSLNGSAFTNATNTLSAVSANAGRYSLDLTQSETSQLGCFILRYSSATCFEQGPEGGPVMIVPSNPYNPQYLSQQSRLQGATSTSAISLGSGETTADGFYAGAGILIEFTNGERQFAIISTYTGATRTANLQNALTRLPVSTNTYWLYPGAPATPLSDVWNAPVSSYTTSGTFGFAAAPALMGSAQSGRNSGISLPTTAVATDDYYNNMIIQIVNGTGLGQSAIISDYTGATRSAEVNRTWATNPDSTSEIKIYAFGAVPGASAPTANQNAQAVWEYSSGRTVDSVSTVSGIASTASVAPRPGSFSNVTIGGVIQLNSGVSLLAGKEYSDVTVRINGIPTGTYSGVTVGVNNIAAGTYSGVTVAGVTQLTSGVSLLGGKSYSDVTVQVGNVVAILSSGRDQIVQSLLSYNVGNSRIVQEYLWPLRNRVQTDPASSTVTVFKPDDTTSAWTASVTTSTVALSGFDPLG